MRARTGLLLGILFLLSGCAVYKTPQITKIALLAPFEGQYREIGYEALYAARLAINEIGISNIDLLAIDDGGSIETATLRIKAINQDHSIAAVIVLGHYSASSEAQLALQNIPMLIVGHWNARPKHELVYMLSNPDIDSLSNFEGEITDISTMSEPIQGSEILSLNQVPLLLDDPGDLRIYSSGSLPDADFRERYINSAEFVPAPRLLAPLSYDATRIVLESIQNKTSIGDLQYEGIHGLIEFENGYWVNAPINIYQYIGTELVPTN